MQPESASLSVLERLGFDTTSGIARTGGDGAFYLELLNDFRNDYLERIGVIRSETDAAARQRLAHDLKGVLRLLGETRIAQMAEAWEAAAMGNADSTRHQALVCDALERLSAGFEDLAHPRADAGGDHCKPACG